MRLLGLKVENFGPIRAAELSFGPGLNVLYGPNDLGKSHLVAAIRVALLYPHDRKDALDYAPWGTDRTPEVQLDLELNPELRYRIKKTLGKGSRGSSELSCSRAGGTWKLEEKGREVDGKLCDLLRWGLEKPGGGKGRKPAPDTYLTRVLLGRQAEVLEVFEHSLADDPQETGKDRLTAALQALGQDPLFRQVLADTTTEYEKAFDARGYRRSAKDAVWAKLNDQIKQAREALQGLQTQVNESEAEKLKLQQLLERQLVQQQACDQAEQRLAQVQSVLQAQACLDLARAERERVQRELLALTQAGQEVMAKGEEVTRLQSQLEAAQERLRLAEAARQACVQELQRQESAREQGLGRRRDELDRQRLEHQHALEQAQARLQAAEEVGRLEAELTRAEALLSRQREEVARHKAMAQGAGLILSLTTAQAQLREARGHHERLQAALEDRRQRASAQESASARLSEARRKKEEAEAALRLAQDALRRIESQEGGQQRLLREQELGRLHAEAESALKDARARAGAARQAREAAERVEQRQDALAASAAELKDLRQELERLELQLTQAEEALAQVHGLEAYLTWREAAEVERQAELRHQRAVEQRAEAGALRSRAAELESSLQSRRLPTREGLNALRQLDRERSLAEAKLGVGLTVTLEALQALAPQVVLDDAPAPGSPATLPSGQRASWAADRRIQLTLGDLARLSVEGGRPADRQQAAELRARWEQEGAAALAAAGVVTLDALEAACEEAEQRRRDAAELRRQAEALATQVQDVQQLEEQLSAARAQAEDRKRRLAGLDLAALEAASQGLTRAALEPRAQAAERERGAARAARDEIRTRLGAEQARLEAQEQELADARAKAQQLATPLGTAPQIALAEAEKAEARARDNLASIDSEREALAEEASLQLTQAREAVETTTRERDQAAGALEAAQQEHDQARTALATLEGALQGLQAAADAVDPEAPAAQVAQLRAQLSALTAAHPDGLRLRTPEDPRPQLTAALEEAEQEARAVELAASAQEGNLGRSRQTFQEKRQALGGDWAAIAAEAQTTTRERQSALERTKAELATLERSFEASLAAARASLDSATAQRASAEQARDAADRAQQEAARKLSELQGALAVRKGQVAALDLPTAQSAERAAEDALRAVLPPGSAPATQATLEAAQRECDQHHVQLRSLNKEIDQAQGALAKVGGGVVQEKAKDAEEALLRAEDRERQVALDYEAWKLLKETLEEVERAQTTNLGQTLAKPVAERFRQLAGPAYGPLALGPDLEVDLKTGSIQVQGELRPLSVLSVGTREQLATLLRVTVAAQLGCAVVLDDQLTQSDPARLEWFKTALRKAGETSQVVVVTCRPADYLNETELPGAASTMRDAENVRAVDLQRSVKRLT